MTSFSYTEPIREPSLFVGRETLCDKLCQQSQSAVVIGEGRVGKSSLLLQLKTQLSDSAPEGRQRLPIYVNLRNPTVSCISDFYRVIAIQMARHFTIILKEEVDLPEIRESTGLLRFLDMVRIRGLVATPVLLIDDLDQPAAFLHNRLLFYSGLRQVLDFSADSLPVRIIASATPAFLDFGDSLVSKLRSRLQTHFLGSFDRNEVWELASREPVIRNATQSEAIRDHLYRETGGHPCLLQEILVNALNRAPDEAQLLRAIELECQELSERGASFFQQYLSEFQIEDVLVLLGLSLGASAEQLQLTLKMQERLRCAALVSETQPSDLLSNERCMIFFRWLRRNVALLIPRLLENVRMISEPSELLVFLKVHLPRALERVSIKDERQLQDLVQALLLGAQISFAREVAIDRTAKRYYADFGLPELKTAIEVKLAKQARQVGSLIDEMEADWSSYMTRFDFLIFLVVDLSGGDKLRCYVEEKASPTRMFCHVVI